jgi:hypothetical protein
VPLSSDVWAYRTAPVSLCTISTGPSSSSGLGGTHLIKGSSSTASHMIFSSACKLSTGSLGVSRTKKDSHSSESNGSLCWSSRSEKKTASSTSSFCQMSMRPSGRVRSSRTNYLERCSLAVAALRNLALATWSWTTLVSGHLTVVSTYYHAMQNESCICGAIKGSTFI